MWSFRRVLASLFVFSLPAFAHPSIPGIRNFYQVDDHVYRGGQPTAEGLKYLAKIGVKTVLDLRGEGDRSAAEGRLVTGLGMRYVNVAMTGLTPPTPEQIVKILMLLEDNTSGPVFVHCMRGADRTGVVIAAYHIEHDHWDNARALKDAMACGMSFFQLPRQSYIRRFQPVTLEAKTADPPAQVKVPAAVVLPAAVAH